MDGPHPHLPAGVAPDRLGQRSIPVTLRHVTTLRHPDAVQRRCEVRPYHARGWRLVGPPGLQQLEDERPTVPEHANVHLAPEERRAERVGNATTRGGAHGKAEQCNAWRGGRGAIMPRRDAGRPRWRIPCFGAGAWIGSGSGARVFAPGGVESCRVRSKECERLGLDELLPY